MWKSIDINEKNYFFKVNFLEEHVKFLFYDLEKIFEESCTLSELLERAKNLNKRIVYDDKTIKETLQTVPDQAELTLNGFGGLKLRQKFIVLENPFIFEWKLEKISVEQKKISALKDLVRKSEVAHGESTSSAQEKVKNIAQRLTHLKSKARSRHILDLSQQGAMIPEGEF